MTRDQRIAFETAVRERARLEGWLRAIALRCRGLAPDLAGYALRGNVWADGFYPQGRKETR